MPWELAEYREELHGPGIAGIRTWSVAARTWLKADKTRRLPGDRDLLSVYRETVALIRAL